ncbi:MAG TPA: His/Gly/Thr/Pro-type tRNA ligase C-terminal domain-containing protein, partial [Atribacterota bacterium]|nr:His/Gly/Thr/Pro-type tRNA ligase C-terminal domain-containing protein [Atribacterota bacterium]
IISALKIANQIRAEGIATEMDFLGKSLKAQLRVANKLEIPYVLILGSDEMKENKVSLKNMLTGAQEIVALENILPYLKSLVLSKEKNTDLDK